MQRDFFEGTVFVFNRIAEPLSMIARNKLPLYWQFYKSTIIVNIACSSALPFANYPELIGAFKELFAISFSTLGLSVVLVYKEFVRKHEYYFYYNRSITKWQLFLACVLFNLSISVLLFII